MYEIKYLKLDNGKEPFLEWLNSLDKISKKRIEMRLIRIQDGNFGDFKKIAQDLFELRFKFSSGYRVYYTIQNNKIILLIAGGDKSTQSKDIEFSKKLIELLKEQNYEN